MATQATTVEDTETEVGETPEGVSTEESLAAENKATELDYQLEVVDADGTVLHPQSCPGCGGNHAYEVLSQQAPNISLINPFDHPVTMVVSYADRGREYPLAPGERLSISGVELEMVQSSFDEDGSIFERIEFIVFPARDEELVTLRTNLIDAIKAYIDHLGVEVPSFILEFTLDQIEESVAGPPLDRTQLSFFNGGGRDRIRSRNNELRDFFNLFGLSTIQNPGFEVNPEDLPEGFQEILRRFGYDAEMSDESEDVASDENLSDSLRRERFGSPGLGDFIRRSRGEDGGESRSIFERLRRR